MTQYQRAHSHRIIGAAIYDWLVCLGLLMIGGFIAVGINKLITGNDELDSNFLYQLYLIAIILGYFLYFWKRSGQTVGMKAWRIKLVSQTNQALSYRQMLSRLISALPAFGFLLIGVLWQYIGSEQLNWQDKVSKTKLIYLPKPNKIH